MAVSFPGGPAPAPGADDPLALLSACHGRISRQCATLERLSRHLPAHGSDAAAQTAAASVLRYFDTAAAHHHEDEEEDLFPALIESMAGSDAVCLHALVDGLIAEHRQLAQRWEPLRQALSDIAEGRQAELPMSQVQDFASAYAAHIQREESELLPMAARLIADDVLVAIGQAMKSRRGGEAG
ncbi:hemerythrin domain-containing protein [Achromobacter insolitus]|uniref:hemerythrin domain-containing protein n=1 Tax=Achromobacter insolitus TaxID=217204 RepID=UPI00265B3EBC|nr:hemerythrin domain-containing protein [Achromobacter insolitus]WKK19259.1 hemerythrin domain-containing protein [Achromobacter insolitus]